jgi:hypothetical protein
MSKQVESLANVIQIVYDNHHLNFKNFNSK